MTDNQKKTIVESNLKNRVTLEILQPDFDNIENSKNKVTDLESIEKIRTAKSEVAFIDEKLTIAEALFLETEKKEKELVEKLSTIQTELVDAKKKSIGSFFAI